MKYLNLLIAALFILFAYWQLNDIDWPKWVAMYSYVAIVAIYRFFKPLPKALPMIGLAVAIVWMTTLVPAFID